MAYLEYGLVSDGSGTVELFSDPSYTVRACNLFIKEVSISNYDQQYHTYYQQKVDGKWAISNEYYFTNGSVPTIGTVLTKNQENWVYAGINQGTLNDYTQFIANSQNQFQLETGVPINNNANGNYDDGIAVPVNGTVEFETIYDDNLLEGSFSTGTHYLQMALWDLPGTADPTTIDLSASTVTFSSSLNLDPANTVTIPFDSSELEIPIIDAGTADHLWKINRNVLTNQSIPDSGVVDLSSLKRIKFNIVSNGGSFVFRTGQLKMVPTTYSHSYANVNNKTGVLSRETWPTVSQNDMPVLIQNGLKVKDFTYVAKISLQTAPSSGTTEFSMFGRVNPDFIFGTAAISGGSVTYPSTSGVYPGTAFYPTIAADANSYLRSKLLITSNNIEIKMYEDHLGNLDNEVFNIIHDEPITQGDYFFVTNFVGNKWESILFSSEDGSGFVKERIIETGKQNISNPWLRGKVLDIDLDDYGKGYAGYQFKPSEVGGFNVDYIYSKEAVLAEYESKTFNSYSPVKAVSLFSSSVPDIELLSGNIEDFERVQNTNNFNFSGKTECGFIANPQNADIDDVVVEEDTNIFYRSKSLKIIKKEDAKIAAVQYKSKLKINDFSKLIFKTKIRFNDLLNVGDFRIVFWNENKTRVLYLQDLPDLVPNEWNEVDIPLSTNVLYNNQFVLEIGHYGEIEPIPPITDPYGYFWIEDVQLTLEAVEWEASNNDGRTYVPFLDAINGEYKSINFASQNYYTSIINKNPYILWEFNTGDAGYVLPKDDVSYTVGEFITTSIGSLNDYLVNTPGWLSPTGESIAISGVGSVGANDYYIPESVKKFKNNKAIAIYGGTESYLETRGTVTLGEIFGIGVGSATNITGSIRFYTDTINNDITILSCQDALASDTNSWSFSIQNTNNLVFTSNNVGTVTATVPTWNDQNWHTACFTYDYHGSILTLYWDGDLIANENLSSDLIFDYKLKIPGPTATIPHNTFNSFNPDYPFIFIDNISIHQEVLDQNEINKDYIAAISEYNKLKVRARAYTTNAWIYGYEIIPHYAKMGRLRELFSRSITVDDSFSATEDTNQGIIFDQAIFDESTFGND